MTTNNSPRICVFCLEFTRRGYAGFCELKGLPTSAYDVHCDDWTDSLTGERATPAAGEPTTQKGKAQ